MLLPSRLDRWFAEAVARVYAPWLTAGCVGDRQRREVAELIERARRVACLPPLEPAPVPVLARPWAPHPAGFHTPVRAATGRWMRAVA